MKIGTGKNTLQEVQSGFRKQSEIYNERSINTADIKLLEFLANADQQILNENYYTYTGQNLINVSSNSTKYAYLKNDTGKEIIIHPSRIVILNGVNDKSIAIKISRYKNSVVDENSGLEQDCVNLGNLNQNITVKPKLLAEPNVTIIGDELIPLRTYIFNDTQVSENELGKMYILKPNESILTELTNLTNNAIDIFIVPAFSFLDANL